uniref:ARAD1D20262p n=1 Tax=Blastobotrys adeninivorans TaxID=409370 RepID=A0A060TG46_BLAAD
MRISALCALMGLTPAMAHMEMVQPAPIKSKYNRFYGYYNVDYSYNAPLGQFPCKGYHIGEPRQSVATYVVGVPYTLKLLGTATHFGGSCQISLSYNGGANFTVIKSIIGGCPIDLEYTFVVPETAPTGQALLSWSWISQVGNRDFYQNCAWVDIVNYNKGDSIEIQGPPMWVSQLEGMCKVPEGKDFVYPEPGDNVEYGGEPQLYTTICDFEHHEASLDYDVPFDNRKIELLAMNTTEVMLISEC